MSEKKILGDFSLHFTLKGSCTLDDIKKAFNKWKKNNSEFYFSTPETEKESRSKWVTVFPDQAQPLILHHTVLHHCFMPRWLVLKKDFAPDICNFLDTVASRQVHWYHAGTDLKESRLLMLENIRRVNGVALFFGDMIEGVREEAELCDKLGIKTRSIFIGD